MNEDLLKTFQENNTVQAASIKKFATNPFLFKLFLLRKLPMAFIAGLKVKHLDNELCEISVPFKWLNQNPFGSTYFAVLAMAAEMSSGMIALMHTFKSKPSVSMLVTHLEAEFIKKATDITTFHCNGGKAIKTAIEESILSGEGKTITCEAVGKNRQGEVEAIFRVQWSFKARKQL